MKAAGNLNPLPRIPTCAWKTIHFWPCLVFASPGWQLVECHKCNSASEWGMGRCSSQQLCPSLGKATLYRWAAALSLAGARRDMHQDILMAGKPKGKGHLLGEKLLSFRYRFLPSLADATNVQFAIWCKKLRAELIKITFVESSDSLECTVLLIT